MHADSVCVRESIAGRSGMHSMPYCTEAQMENTGIAAIFAGDAGVAHGISRPLTKLIETVRAGIGELYECQIKGHG